MPKPVRPRPAASLILLRSGAGGPEVLLGRRGAAARFMPGRFVFPGGGVQRGDSRPWLGEGPLEEAPNALRRAARAALRETFEETGFLIARKAATRIAGNGGALTAIERAYLEHDLCPHLAALRPVGRAITPSFSSIRFHARFFLADGGTAIGPLHAGEELEEVAWYDAGTAFPAPMSGVTQFMLRHALAVWRGTRPAGLPLYHYVRGQATIAWTGGVGPIVRERVVERDA